MSEHLCSLVGIARLASEGNVLATKRNTEYRTLPTRKWLNRCNSDRVPFTWTINPYRGCEYGCKYCYARFTHEFLELRDPLAFEHEIYAKDWNRESFLQELAQLRPGQVIGIGTATDPYQPAERRFGRTFQVLECLLSVRRVSIFITTKSDLVIRDTELLRALSAHNDLRITVTITTLDSSIARLLEPFAPTPDLRISAVRDLAGAGICAGVISSPVLPLITDSEENLRAVALAAKAAQAKHYAAGVLFLKPSTQKVFFPFLAQHYPQYFRRYESSYRAGAFLQSDYPNRIARLVERIRKDLGFANRDLAFEPSVPPEAQMRLF